MTYEQAFLKIKEKFENTDASNVADFAIQVTFMDEDCSGIFYAQVKDGALYVEPYDYRDNSLAITITKSALLAYLGGRSSLDKILDSGDAYVENGDVSKMADWKSTIKKTPAKKAAAKKAAEKKAAPAKKAETKSAPAKKTAAKTTKKAAEKKVEAKAETKTVAKATATKEAKPAAKETKTAAKTTAAKTTKK